MADAEYERRRLILSKLIVNPVLAHHVLFERRHKQATPDFHREIIGAWWSAEPQVGIKAFRGAAKSTIAEEAICGHALFGRFNYGILIGASYALACQRLNAVKHEIRTNDRVNELFGNQEGDTWNEGEITLKTGPKIQAIGAGQSLRGLKHLDFRPDFVLIDDLEDYGEGVPSKEAMDKNLDWLLGALLPACDPAARIRINGTPLHPEAVLERLSRDAGWKFKTYPIVTPPVPDPGSWERANWPERFPVAAVAEIFERYKRLGRTHKFVQEYLCVSEVQSLKLFQQRHVVQAPSIPDWAPSVVIIDPARTTNVATSARTGYVVVSWVGSKCYIRHAKGEFHKPDEIVAETYRLDDRFKPIWVMPEKDGLAEFLLQPFRTRALETGRALPLLPVQAPRDRNKASFISGLQPFFDAGEMLMCGDFPDLVEELLGFPTGRVDVLNALAYAPGARPGKPVYPDFAFHHVGPEALEPRHSQPAFLCIAAGQGHVAASLAQFIDGAVRVYADWVREGAPAEAVGVILPEARLIEPRLKVVAPIAQFDRYMGLGLPAALTRLNAPVQQSLPDRTALARFLQRTSQHQPAFLVARSARWTINALAGGYAFPLDKSGILRSEPLEGPYRTLMEALEGFVAWLTVEAAIGDTGPVNYEHLPDGRRFISARPGRGRGEPRDLKLVL